MKLLQAAEIILKEAGHPMRCSEMIAQILARGLWETKGKTPADTLSSDLYGHISTGGTIFIKVGRGLYALRNESEINHDDVPNVQPSTQEKPKTETKKKDGGYVYVLTNPSLKGLVKIGRTEKGKLNDRLLNLNTAVPFDFVVRKLYETKRYIALEDHVHANLMKNGKQIGSHKKKEFFKCSPSEAVAVIQKMVKDMEISDGRFVEYRKGMK